MENGINLGLLGGLCPASPAGVLDGVLCFLATWELPILVLVVAAVAFSIWWQRREDVRDRQTPPPLVFPLTSTGGGRAGGLPGRRERTEPRVKSAPSQPDSPATPDPTRRTVLKVPHADPSPAPDPRAPDDSDGVVQYQRPPDGTLQLLPGRLEVERGPGEGREIRFVRVPGSPAEVTFGRSEGPEFRHVQLHSPTVSRQHARMSFNGTLWTVRNESSTNPTRVNGRTLSSGVEEVPLADGDTLEIGDITFRFRHEGASDRLPFRSSWHTDQGRRPTNQDAVVVRALPDGRELAAVCDGMGSHHAGGLASHRALEGLVEGLTGGLDLEAAVQHAHSAVLQAASEADDREGMGTTLVALLRTGDRYDIANVGDSRAYRIGPDGVQQLTHDHSFMAEALRDGRMSTDEAARSPWRNAVTRNLGAEGALDVDVFPGFDATKDHVVILCTDGVHGVLSDEEIGEVWRDSADIRDLSRALSEEALMQGGEDNVAVAAMAFSAPGSDVAGGDSPASEAEGSLSPRRG